MAHEIRNPLGVIEGSAETLTKRLPQLDPLSTELIGYISAEVGRLNTLVNRFLTFARPLQPQRRIEEITVLLERALKTAVARRPELPVIVDWEYSTNLTPLLIDPELFEEVFTNLIFDAFEAMPQGGRLSLRVRSALWEGREGIELEVEVTGNVIPAGLPEQIVNPFFTTKKMELGSAVSRLDDCRGA